MENEQKPAGDEPSHAVREARTNADFRHLRAVMAEYQPRLNKHDLTFLMIHACLDTDMNAGPRIVGALGVVGLNRKYVGMMLRDGIGRHWDRQSDGTYTARG